MLRTPANAEERKLLIFQYAGIPSIPPNQKSQLQEGNGLYRLENSQTLERKLTNKGVALSKRENEKQKRGGRERSLPLIGQEAR